MNASSSCASWSAGPSGASPAVVLRQRLVQAVLAQDMAAAEDLLADLPPAGDAELDQIAARLYTATQQWDKAAAVLSRMDDQDPQVRVMLNLARNLAAASHHRPELYDLLVHTPAPGLHKLHRLPDGQFTITRQLVSSSDDATMFLSVDKDPAAAAAHRLTRLDQALQRGEAVALGGVGDGYLLSLLGPHRPTLMLQQQVAIHIIEPQPEVLLHAMMIHDYTGPAGCIEQDRFIWHLGSDWKDRYTARLLRDEPFLPHPGMLVQLDQAVVHAKAAIADVLNRSQAVGEQLMARQQARYDNRDRHELASLLSDDPPRPPRVMLLTSRFTTVLRHEAARIAAALQEMGWHARVVMEPADHHRILAMGVCQAIEDHQPDLLLTLDHLRHEQGRLIPPGLPYLCWVQDLLPNITSPDAGRAVDDNQWVISFCTPLLVSRYGYPPDRCLDAPIMLASTPALPNHWKQDGPDLAYVSNVSQDIPAMVDATLASAAEGDREILHTCCERLIDHYQQGGCLPGKPDIGRLVQDLLAAHFDRHGATLPVDQAIRVVIDHLWNPLNIGLYRQQALGWVMQIAQERNLTLALHGRGWESHPQFAPFARGIIEPGKPLQNLVRRTRINLNLEPYPCTTHVRLLDGLTAGGFYLMRDHPANTGLTQLARFLDEHAPHAVNDAQALAATPALHRDSLRQQMRLIEGVSYDHPPDVVAQLRCYQRGAVMAADHTLLPGLEDVSFDSLATCRERIIRFMDDDAARRRVSQSQRQAVLARLTLQQGLRRMLDQISQSMATSADLSASPRPLGSHSPQAMSA